MRISQEIVTVWADPAAGEVNIVLAGLRIALTSEETESLADGLVASLGQLRGARRSEAGEGIETEGRGRPAARAVEARPTLADKSEAARPFVSPAPEAEAKQLRTRTLIHANIRDKGLTVREDHPEREDQKA
jgi:hypothetical protein